MCLPAKRSWAHLCVRPYNSEPYSSEKTLDNQLERDVTELWALVFRLLLDGEKLVTAQLAEHNLTTPQFYVLKTLSEHDGRSAIGQIARLHGLTNATMTGLVK